uniref:Uncharacterized protein n=1 Tax=Nelumbo nucifera TaxID=4432 RepID=A0A822YVZ2_NELNU|nr:TPA_asm: hypothetical protein HUJ06_007348 [Nelumbo nucifera]
MGSCRITLFFRISIVLVILLSVFRTLVATRLLDGDIVLQLQSLPRGTVAPSGRSGCTYRPNNGGGVCPPIKSKKVAGHVLVAPPVFPGVIVDFGAAASADNETRVEHRLS